MILAIDVGNTNTHAGIFDIKKSVGANNYSPLPVDTFYFPGAIRRYAKKIHKVIIVSVAPNRLRVALKELKRYYSGPVAMVGRDIHVPLKSEYNPKQIGQDRLVTAYAAAHIYGSPVLIIDFGTAVTFDVVSSRGVYCGGLILPGLKMSLESLHKGTALLPEVMLKKTPGFIGRNTGESIRHGMIYGYASLTEGLIRRFRRMFKGLRIVATGGNAHLIGSYTPLLKQIDGALALKGLCLLEKSLLPF
ncbi:MAG: type III pantothenate kinase [Candidatus Omnitrophica bacterium]|nr:type III pantothenate kinase [Candidatus Omnitrophota bacterium]